MAKRLETVISEWQKTLDTLVAKVSSLEARIGEQSTIITNQSQLIARLNSVTSEMSLTATRQLTPEQAAPPPAALQRPVRQARLNAGLALSAKKQAKKTLFVSQPRVPTNSSSKLPETSRVATEDNPTSSSAVQEAAPKLATISSDSEWKIVTHKKSRVQTKSRKIFSGAGKEDLDLQTVERLKYIQAWSFKPDTTEDNIRKFLNKINKSNEYFVQKRQIKTDRHASFIIGIPESCYDRVNTPAVWPPGVRYSDWFLVRARPSERASTTPTK